jgi:hypothetical protein
MQPSQPTIERKPPPTVEVSMNYLSWSVKDLVKVTTANHDMQSRLVAHMADTLDKIQITLDKLLVVKSKDTPF